MQVKTQSSVLVADKVESVCTVPADPVLSLQWEGPTAVTAVGALWRLPLAPGLVKQLIPVHPQPLISQEAQAGPHIVCLGFPARLQGLNHSWLHDQTRQVSVLAATVPQRLLPSLFFLHQNQDAFETVEVLFSVTV